MKEITLRSYAKINLSLRVLRRREGGYHDISSLMQGIDLCDVINIKVCAENGTKYNLPHCLIDGTVVYLCADADTIPMDMSNLALKGIKAVLDEVSSRANEIEVPKVLLVKIEKRLPVAAGIAGGSGNAAACMLGLNALMGHPLSLRELMGIGTGVGADVPFSVMMNARCNAGELNWTEQNREESLNCIEQYRTEQELNWTEQNSSGELSRTEQSMQVGLRGLIEASSAAMISGIGEIVEPTEPIARHIIMANPGIAVSTRAAYEAIDAELNRTEESDGAELSCTEQNRAAELWVNDFESYTLANYPEAKHLRELMEQELRAERILMSGSGPTMIAYYEDGRVADEDYENFRCICANEEGYRIWRTSTGTL